MRCIHCSSVKSVMQSGATAAYPWKLVDTTARTACSKFRAPVCALRRIGETTIIFMQSILHGRRCARNCFLCPNCRNTLSVVPSDPPEDDGRSSIPLSAIGEPPFFLYCNHCRWDSAEVDITFEKPTGLAGTQLLKLQVSNSHRLLFQPNCSDLKTPRQTLWNSSV